MTSPTPPILLGNPSAPPLGFSDDGSSLQSHLLDSSKTSSSSSSLLSSLPPSLSSLVDLYYYFEVEEIIRFIIFTYYHVHAKAVASPSQPTSFSSSPNTSYRVSLQFPDSLLPYSLIIHNFISQRFPSLLSVHVPLLSSPPLSPFPPLFLYINGDSSSSSSICCVDEISHQHVDSHVTIKFGQWCGMRNNSQPIRNVGGKVEISTRQEKGGGEEGKNLAEEIIKLSLEMQSDEEKEGRKMEGVIVIGDLEYLDLIHNHVRQHVISSSLSSFLSYVFPTVEMERIPHHPNMKRIPNTTNLLINKEESITLLSPSSSIAPTDDIPKPNLPISNENKNVFTVGVYQFHLPPTHDIHHYKFIFFTHQSDNESPHLHHFSVNFNFMNGKIIQFKYQQNNGFNSSSPGDMKNISISSISSLPLPPPLPLPPSLSFFSSPFSPSHSRLLSRRFYLMQKLKNASILGIIINSITMKNLLPLLSHLQSLIKYSGKKSYSFIMNKITEVKVSNFHQDIEIFIMISCPFNVMNMNNMRGEKWGKDIVTVVEAIWALEGREWDGEYKTQWEGMGKIIEEKKNKNKREKGLEDNSKDKDINGENKNHNEKVGGEGEDDYGEAEEEEVDLSTESSLLGDEQNYGIRYDPIEGKMKSAAPNIFTQTKNLMDKMGKTAGEKGKTSPSDSLIVHSSSSTSLSLSSSPTSLIPSIDPTGTLVLLSPPTTATSFLSRTFHGLGDGQEKDVVGRGFSTMEMGLDGIARKYVKVKEEERAEEGKEKGKDEK